MAHKLIHDVPTRWNTSFDMVERYLEQQAAVYSALTDKSLKKNVKDIVTLSDADVRAAEEILQVLKPLKTVTTLMSPETAPSVSLILPPKSRILAAMDHSDGDNSIIREVKSAIKENLLPRYTEPPTLQEHLHRSTALDPRFKCLSHIDSASHQVTYRDVTREIVDKVQAQANSSPERDPNSSPQEEASG
ncbi:hypothetical protein SKAU_G00416810 [Synaphobranchus kaupii]|uniref:Zinc finger BED domain-containing 1-like protein n=1 Tax=Synaphobranchus kaupii TaxID=118154 RepID=A0A9Q1E640_SYNKA|nr:hypothetical protein SKAU_G00416810 [Synaphobranchus kaupii]